MSVGWGLGLTVAGGKGKTCMPLRAIQEDAPDCVLTHCGTFFHGTGAAFAGTREEGASASYIPPLFFVLPHCFSIPVPMSNDVRERACFNCSLFGLSALFLSFCGTLELLRSYIVGSQVLRIIMMLCVWC